MGRSSPSSAAAPDRLRRDRGVRMLAQFGALDHRRPLVEQAGQRAQQPRLALSAFAEQHDVVAGDQGPLQLRKHGVLEAEDAGPRVAALGQRGQQVLPDLVLDAPLAMAGGTQLADGPGQIIRWGHHSTLRLLSTSRAWAHAQAGDDRVCTRHAVEGWHLRPLGAGLATPHSGSSLPLMRSTRFARVNVGSKCANMSAFIVPNVVPGRSFIPS